MLSNMPSSLSIGDFSRATHLTVKTLRHYHEAGLLVPAEIDSRTGYRRYAVEQIVSAQIIRRFRNLDMPVNEIQAVLGTSDPQGRNELIVAHLKRLEAELSRTQCAVASLRDLLESPAQTAHVERRRIAATPAAAIREILSAKGAFAWVSGALAELGATVKAQKLTATGAPGGVFANPIFSYGRGEATLFIPVAGTVRATDRVAGCMIPEVEIAVLMHEGPHTNVDMTYGALGSYVAQHALAVPGPIREYYLSGPHDTPDESAWRTEIGWPIFHTG